LFFSFSTAVALQFPKSITNKKKGNKQALHGCDCVAYSMGKFCSHSKKAIEKIEEIIGKIKKENKL